MRFTKNMSKILFYFSIFNQRTITIRENLSKLSQLNFDKEFDIKPMSMYPGIKVSIPTKKGKK